MSDLVGVSVAHVTYVPFSAVHYSDGLVNGAYTLGLFGDVATHLCTLTDGCEGLLAGYSDVAFLAPLQAGAFLRTRGEVLAVGRRSRRLLLEAHRLTDGLDDETPGPTLGPGTLIAKATAIVVVPEPRPGA